MNKETRNEITILSVTTGAIAWVIFKAIGFNTKGAFLFALAAAGVTEILLEKEESRTC